jgi:hypothetical protein
VRLYSTPDDFEAVIRIYTEAEGGRRSPAFNGIRWDLAYAEDPPGAPLFAIYPDFVDEHGHSLPADQPLRVGIELPARLVVLNDELRVTHHRSRIREGIRFYCQEAARRVAEGRVTRITGLPVERSHS